MKHHVLLIIPFFLLLNTVQVSGQTPDETSKYWAGLGMGASFTGYKDKVASPINRYTDALTYYIIGGIEKGNFLHSINMHFFIGDSVMSAPFIGYEQENFLSARGNIKYACDYRLWGTSLFPGYLGAASRMIFHYTGVDTKTAVLDELTPPTYLGIISLDLHITQKWILNSKNSLILSAAYPIIGYSARPPFASYDELMGQYLLDNNFLRLISIGSFTSFHNYSALSGELKYQYDATPFISVFSCLAFELSYINLPKHRPRTDALVALNLGIVFNF